MILLALLIGCIQEAPLPNVGSCTTPPAGVYEYGQISPGDCITGPVEIQFVEDAEGSSTLLLTNSNPYQIFTHGSLMAIPWSSIDLGVSRNPIESLDGLDTLQLPSFAAGLARSGDLGLVTVRLSEDSRTRSANDEVHLIDLSQLPLLSSSDRGTGGSDTVEVGPDPVDVVVDPQSGLAFVANRTAHSISVLDVSGETVEVVLPWEEYALSSATFEDGDLSGSRADLADLETTDSTLVPDDLWTLEWIAGTWRLWLPSEDGVTRTQTVGNGVWNESAIGIEFGVEDTAGLLDTITDPAWASGRLFFSDGGSIHTAIVDEYLGDWELEYVDLFSGRPGKWDEDIGAPALTFSEDGVWLFYEGTDGDTQGIGQAFSEDGYAFSREEDPVLVPTWDHEALRIGDPFVVFDSEIDLWRMYYSAYDGASWTIGHATSADLVIWESDDSPILEVDGGDIAAPVVSRSVGEWKLWASTRTNDEWSVVEAVSADGSAWTLTENILSYDASVAFEDEPPGIALDADPTDAFRVEGENWGLLQFMASPGATFESVQHGWSGTPIAGFELDLGAAGSASEGGIRVDSVLESRGLAWLTLRSSGGVERIGVATLDSSGALWPEDGAILEGESGFHQDGVSSPVVFDEGDQLRMYFAGLNGSVTTIGTATSDDGLSWTIQDSPVLEAVANWESAGILPGAVELLDDGSVRLWYSGSDGEEWRISSATRTTDGSFVRDADEDDWLLDAGAPGEWDDSGVRDPWVVPGTSTDGQEGAWLFYSGFDGDLWRGGVAFFTEEGGDVQFERTWSERTESTRASLPLTGGMFHPDGIQRPILLETEEGWTGWFSGLLGEDYRVGTATGREPTALHKTPRRPTLGDRIVFSTERGDPEVEAIPLDTDLSDMSITGLGLIALDIDSERGLLFAHTRHQPWLVAVDIRDDSDDDTGFQDLNALDIEAVIRVQTAAGAAGFRQLIQVGDLVYALNDDPDSVFVLDLSELEDGAFSQVIYDSQIGGLGAERDLNKDAGIENSASVGPGQMALHPDGKTLFVTNFNHNSVSVFDLTLGIHGELIRTIGLIGENPYGIAIHPDGSHAVVGNYSGETDDSGVSHSTLAVIDTDPSSAHYLEVLTWIVNHAE